MAQSTTQDRPSLHLTRHYPVAPEKVWRAWTEPQALSAWFGPGDTESVTRRTQRTRLATTDALVSAQLHMAVALFGKSLPSSS
jgi:uncharacterized protein YndB with AHSA1/START domain